MATANRKLNKAWSAPSARLLARAATGCDFWSRCGAMSCRACPVLSRVMLHQACKVVSCRVASCHVMSCHLDLRCYAMSCPVMSHHVICVISLMSCHVMSCHVMSCHVMSCHVMPCHAMPCRVMSCHVMSCHTVSLAVLSHWVVSRRDKRPQHIDTTTSLSHYANARRSHSHSSYSYHSRSHRLHSHHSHSCARVLPSTSHSFRFRLPTHVFYLGFRCGYPVLLFCCAYRSFFSH